jgi:signal transduction histidine kinase
MPSAVCEPTEACPSPEALRRPADDRCARREAALRRVATLVARTASTERVLAAIAEEVGQVLEAGVTTIVRSDDGHAGLAMAEWRSPDEGRPAHDGPSHGVRSSIAAAIVVDDVVWGRTVVVSRPGQMLEADAEAKVAAFNELAAMAVTNDKSRDTLARLAAEQAALRRVATHVARGAGAAELFGAVTEEIGQLLPVDHVALRRYEPDGTVVYEAVWSRVGEHDPPAGTRLEVGGNNLAAKVQATGRSARIDDYVDTTGPVGDAARGTGLRSAVATPIVVERRLWGVMSAGSVQPEPLPADTEARLASFTDLLATAISNAEVHAALRSSRARLVTAADDTRRRIERDLHDGAQQRLVHTVVALKLTLQALDRGADDARELAAEALHHAELATTELRELAHGILPGPLMSEGLRGGVAALTARHSLPIAADVLDGRLPAHVEATAYFVISEALANVTKHAAARSVTVAANVAGGALRVEVADDGRGGVDVAKGSGLTGLIDRVEALGGSLELTSRIRQGTTLVASIPIDAVTLRSV